MTKPVASIDFDGGIDDGPGQPWKFDPRFLLFEFTWNIVLRDQQYRTVVDFISCLATGRSKVKQMIMGAGKTTVVAPLLALMLADGKSLAMSVVPKALLEMSRTRMRETFSTIMVKRIYTLTMERGTAVGPAMYRTLANAIRNRGIVVTTPVAVKSIALCYIENLGNVAEAKAGRFRGNLTEVQDRARQLSKILGLFRDGVILLDEVDLILHPLKSELNFPMGEKFDLDVTEQGERWGLPIHLLDAVFAAVSGTPTSFEQRGMAIDILQRLKVVFDEGFKKKALQRLPHVTLLNTQFYHDHVKPILAEWTFLWLQKQHLHGIDFDEAKNYMLKGAAARSETSMKGTLLEIAIRAVKVKLGLESALPEKPRAMRMRSDSWSGRQCSNEEDDEMPARARSSGQVTTSLQLKRIGPDLSPSIAEVIDEATQTLLERQLAALQSAQQIAEEQRELINSIYKFEEQLEAKLLGIHTEVVQVRLVLGSFLECAQLSFEIEI